MAKVMISLVFVLSAIAGATPEGVAMQDIHTKLSASCFNECWDYLDKPERTVEDTENMILLAYASLWHWTQRSDCLPANLSVGYWQVSRVHAVAGHTEMARHFAQRCLQISREDSLPPFYLGYAYEALARAEILAGNPDGARAHLADAETQLGLVTDGEGRALLTADLESLKALIHGGS
ncbi:hypothetical protein JXA88_02445 [Candidatus Fermentibacteria bacterium]|nr:hypothetical protein [Candidatus Fermentibacteria bacterium]